MGGRLAAGWALIGLAAQCFIAIAERSSFDEGLIRALVHYAMWGLAGWIVGSVVERAIDESFRRLLDHDRRDAEQSTEVPAGEERP